MVFRIFLYLAVILLLTGLGIGAYALGDNEHVRSAFQFAERKDWNNAIQHAKRTDNTAFQKLITWEYLLDADSGAGFDEIANFIEENPNWPEQKKLHIRAEMALHKDNVPDKDVINWFGDSTPLTGVGKVALAEALQRNRQASHEKIVSLIREAWRNGDFDEPQERKILDSYDNIISSEDHIARINRLLWEERESAAKRILNYVPEGQRKLFKARMALIDDKRLAILAVAQVPSSLKNDPGLTYDRMVFRARRDDDKGVREMLMQAPEHPPYPEKWWKYRDVQIHLTIDEKNYSLAKKLLANHGQSDGSGLADALWLQGWLKCEFLGAPKEAYDSFEDMYDTVKYPVSRSRAAYWAGRAAEKSEDLQSALKWFKTASSYPTTFYGQLGILKSNSRALLEIPTTPSVSDEAKHKFEQNDFIKAIRLTIDAGHDDLARHLIALAVENTDDISQVTLVTELGEKAGHSHLSVHAAKKALHQNIVLVEGGYPTPKTPSGVGIERDLTLAITRQESEFDPGARSPSNALGMMQLLPRTAKEIAKRNGLSFNLSRLSEPNYNMTLGSYYLARLINSYDGSYIMGIAAYNAGPGNVHHWVGTFGTPGNDVNNAVNWIEKIPFTETRNYVQRVLENLQVYRAIEADDKPLKLTEDLKR